MNLSAKKIVEYVSGDIDEKLLDGLMISGVSTDSRKINYGDLFIPLIGEKYDAHEFLRLAKESGAVAALCQKIGIYAIQI